MSGTSVVYFNMVLGHIHSKSQWTCFYTAHAFHLHMDSEHSSLKVVLSFIWSFHCKGPVLSYKWSHRKHKSWAIWTTYLQYLQPRQQITANLQPLCLIREPGTSPALKNAPQNRIDPAQWGLQSVLNDSLFNTNPAALRQCSIVHSYATVRPLSESDNVALLEVKGLSCISVWPPNDIPTHWEVRGSLEAKIWANSHGPYNTILSIQDFVVFRGKCMRYVRCVYVCVCVCVFKVFNWVADTSAQSSSHCKDTLHIIVSLIKWTLDLRNVPSRGLLETHLC